MSLRLEMLQVARLAPRLLGDSTELVVSFIQSQQHPDGGYMDRAGSADLYYTVFAVECLFALRAELPLQSLETYLRSFGDGRSLDMVHLACLARGWSILPPGLIHASTRSAILDRLEAWRTSDGGYNSDRKPGDPKAVGTLYGCFLAVGAYQDLGADIPNPAGIAKCVRSLKCADGGYANQHDLPMGLTPSTAAAVTLFRQLDEPTEAAAGDWLVSRAHPQGGFFATPQAPIPDLLSTATALHALVAMHREIEPVKEKTLDFIDTLWSNRGGFFGNWEDDILDCEYLFYALLALGHLSV